MGRKILAFCQVLLLFVRISLYLSLRPFRRNFFLRNLLFFLWFADTWQINLSLSSWKLWRGRLNFIVTCRKEHLLEKNWKILSFFISVEDWATNFQHFDKIFLRGGQYCFLLAHREILVEKIFPKKPIIPFFHFAFSDIERERLTFCRKLSVWLSKLQSPHLKHFEEIYFFSKRSFLYLSVLSASENEHNLLVFLKKLAGLSKLHSMCPEELLFEKKEIFGKNLFLLNQFGTWGEKFWPFVKFCSFLTEFHSTCPCDHFEETYFSETYCSFYDLLTLDK